VPLLHGARSRDEIIAEAENFAPDVLVIDCMLGAGFDAARQLRIPAAVLVHVLYGPFVHLWGDQIMAASVKDLLAGADRVLALTPPGFEEPADVPANTRFVGPITRPGAPGHADRADAPDLAPFTQPGDPRVLLSLSTTEQGQAQALPAMLAAVGSLPVRVLLTLGGVLPADAVTVPPNVTACGFVPHDAALPYMSAVISHGGLSTIMTALAAGVPLVCLPQGREQPLNAERVAACGAGQVVAAGAGAAEIAAVITAVLRDGSARAAAQRFAAEIAALGAGESAAQELEQLAEAGQTARAGVSG